MKILPVFMLAMLLGLALWQPNLARGDWHDLSHNNYTQILFMVWFVFFGVLTIISMVTEIASTWKNI